MKTSLILAASGASLALAGPLDLFKRVWQTEVVIKWTTVYVTEPSAPTAFAVANHHGRPSTHVTLTTSVTVASSSPVPAPPSVAPAVDSPKAVAPSVVATTLVPEVKSSTPEPAPPAPTTTEGPPPPAAPVPDATTPSVPVTTVIDNDSRPSSYQDMAVYHHNIHRLNYSAPAIQWGQTYADYAATTAAKCKFAHDMVPGGGGYGQNLAMWASSGDAKSLGENMAISQSITDMWHNGEVRAYPAGDYGKDSPDMSNFETWGHFSQLVWASSKQVGCHSQYCAPGTMYPNMGAWFTVCNYFPAGNIGGLYGKNVLPPLNEPTVSV